MTTFKINKMKSKIPKTLFISLTILSLVYATDEFCEVTLTNGHRPELAPVFTPAMRECVRIKIYFQ